MQIAQKLYEGVDFGEGPVGLITYMRTDSTSLGAEAIQQLREVARASFTARRPCRPSRAPTRTSRPTPRRRTRRSGRRRRDLTPEQLKDKIDPDLWRLYDLIWKRTLASQMSDAMFNQVTVTLTPGKAAKDDSTQLRATGSTLVKPGFLAVYEEDREDSDEDDDGGRLPALAEGDEPALARSPAAAFHAAAAALYRGEPRQGARGARHRSPVDLRRDHRDTAARKYVDNEKRNFVPTDTGKIVNRFLTKFFPHYVDYDFTARLEDELDEISRGDKAWVPVMREFWGPFIDGSSTSRRASRARKSPCRGSSARILRAAPGQRADRPVRAVRADRHQGRRREAALRRAASRPEDGARSRCEEALALFTLPRTLGYLPDGNEPVSVGVGRFGPYIKYGAKYVSLKADDPYTLTFERALEVIAEKQLADANRLIRDFPDDGIQILNGRFGPYITDGKRNARMPRIASRRADLEECQTLLAAAPLRGKGRFGRKGAKKTPAEADRPRRDQASRRGRPPRPRRRRADDREARRGEAGTAVVATKKRRGIEEARGGASRRGAKATAEFDDAAGQDRGTGTICAACRSGSPPRRRR